MSWRSVVSETHAHHVVPLVFAAILIAYDALGCGHPVAGVFLSIETTSSRATF